jgi:hypothetical protein
VGQNRLGQGYMEEKSKVEEVAACDFWCEACSSYHPVPKTKEQHAALRCFAPFLNRDEAHTEEARISDPKVRVAVVMGRLKEADRLLNVIIHSAMSHSETKAQVLKALAALRLAQAHLQ